MLLTELKAIIEGLLYVAGEDGLTIKQLAEVLESKEDLINDVLVELEIDYKKQGRGLQLVEMAGTFQFTTKPEHAEYLQRLALSPTSQTLSQAALETLAIIAYKQPITRVEIEEVRGVKSDKAIQTLVVKRLVKEIGRVEGTGRAILYGTTNEFLDYFGLKAIQDLPPLPEGISDVSLEEEADLFFTNFEDNFDTFG